jgi:hypothetical protein
MNDLVPFGTPDSVRARIRAGLREIEHRRKTQSLGEIECIRRTWELYAHAFAKKSSESISRCVARAAVKLEWQLAMRQARSQGFVSGFARLVNEPIPEAKLQAVVARVAADLVKARQSTAQSPANEPEEVGEPPAAKTTGTAPERNQ